MSVPSVAAPLLILPAALLIAESLVARPFYVDRYVLYGEAGAALLAGAGLYRIGQWLAGGLRWRPLVAVPGVIVLAGVLLLQLGAQRFDRTPASREFDFGGPSRYVAAHARAGDGVLYFGAFFRKASLGYPADYRKVTDFGVAVTPRASGTFQGINKPFAELRPIMLRYQRIWVRRRGPARRAARRPDALREPGTAPALHPGPPGILPRDDRHPLDPQVTDPLIVRPPLPYFSHKNSC